MKTKRAPDGRAVERGSRKLLLSGKGAEGWKELMRAFDLDSRRLAVYAEGSELSAPTGADPLQDNADPVLLIPALDEAVKKHSRRAWPWAWRGVLRRRALDYRGAVADFDEAWRLGERSARVLTWRGEAKLRVGARAGGLKDLEAALKKPCQAWNWAWCGRAKLTLERGPAGMAYLDRALALDPEDGWHWAWRAEAKRRLRAREGMFEDFARALKLEASGGHRGFILAWRGLAWLEEGRPREALADFEEAVSIADAYAPAWQGKADALRALGRLGPWLEAQERAARLNSRYVQGLYGRPKEELEALALALGRLARKSPRSAVARRWRGLVLMLLGRLEPALQELDRAVRGAQSDAWAFAWRGEALSRAGRAQDAVSDFDQAIALEPGNARTWAARAKAFLALGESGGALSDLDHALELDPHLAPAYAERGCVRLMLGQAKAAARDLEAAVAKDPRFASALADLSAARARLGDAEGSRQARERALALDPVSAGRRLSVWDARNKC